MKNLLIAGIVGLSVVCVAQDAPKKSGKKNRGGFGGGRWALALDPEQRTSPPNCTNGWENEVWVARTFWDLHDTRADGDDILWFIHKGAVINLYLNNGVANNTLHLAQA